MTTRLSDKFATLQIDRFEKRTHFGKVGKKIKIMTNFFEFVELPQICIYQYVSCPIFSFHTSFSFPSQGNITDFNLRFDVNITPDVPPILNRYISFSFISFLSFSVYPRHYVSISFVASDKGNSARYAIFLLFTTFSLMPSHELAKLLDASGRSLRRQRSEDFLWSSMVAAWRSPWKILHWTVITLIPNCWLW